MPLNISPDQTGFDPAPAPGEKSRFALPFAEQIKFFQGKAGLLLPTEHWDDIKGAGHDRAFMVAGAAKADLLTDMYQAVQKTIDEGKSLDWFRKEFSKIVQAKGWDYNGPFDWRTRVIYQTNLQASYAAGRFAQLTHPDLLKSRPFWKYVHNDSVAHPRPLHVKWSGLTLRYDDPWWQAHFPPCGFGCRCRVTAVAEPTAGRDQAPDDGSYDYVDRWGEVHQVPLGVDYGWGYTPGQAWTGKLLMDKAAGVPAQIGAKAVEVAYRETNLLDEVATHYKAWAGSIDRSKPKGERFVVGALKPEIVDFLKAKGVLPETAGITLGDRQYSHAVRDIKKQPLSADDWLGLPDGLDKPMAVLWDLQAIKDGNPPALVFVNKAAQGGYSKIVVELGYRAKDIVAGKKGKIATNAIVTGGVADLQDLKNAGMFQPVQGSLP